MEELTVTQRPWGMFEVIQDTSHYKVKKITVNSHQRLSLQAHNYRSEHWICLSGLGLAQVNDMYVPLDSTNQHNHVLIEQTDKHRLINITDEPLVIIEVQVGTYFGEDDIIRFEDDYGRSGKLC